MVHRRLTPNDRAGRSNEKKEKKNDDGVEDTTRELRPTPARPIEKALNARTKGIEMAQKNDERKRKMRDEKNETTLMS